MIISRISSTDKDFNGVPYKEFFIYCSDRGQNRMIRCTGKTPVLVYAKGSDTGEILQEDRLDQITISKGDSIEVWFDSFNRVSQIDLFVD